MSIESLSNRVDSLAGTVDSLAKEMKKGFAETNALIKLTRQEMAKEEDLQEVKGTVDKIYKMLDNEAGFIQKMEAEHPIEVKRLERVEKKLGLPHRISE